MSVFDLFPGAAVDVVGVFDQSFNQLFVDARAIRATVRPVSKIMEHPIESGGTITDFRVVMPTEIELSLILTPETYKDTFQQIQAVYDAATVISVQTKTGLIGDMLMYEMPHDESPDMFDTVAVALKLRHIILVDAQYQELPPAKVQTKSNSSTVKTGEKAGADATTAQTEQASTAYKAFYQ